jgi:hypothetical protein
VWDLAVDDDPENLSGWASHFRQHYCPDVEIDALRKGTGLTRAQYLTRLAFPDEKDPPGPSIRAGDFAEILVSDFVEYFLGYWVPREKYAEKAVRNESVKGVDIVGFRLATANSFSPADVLIAFEVKAQLSDGKYAARLQIAIDDSSVDSIRRATTLNAIKRRLLHAGENDRVGLVERFQDPADRPYVYLSGAAAVLSDSVYDATLVRETKVAGHKNRENLQLVVIRGKELMKLVHALYQRASDEA